METDRQGKEANADEINVLKEDDDDQHFITF